MNKTEPRYKSLHVTTGFACNNACVFCCDCASEKTSSRRSKRLAPAVVRRMLENNVELGTVVFSGHEPTMNPDLVEWVGWACELGYSDVCLVTNGRLLAKNDLASRLVTAGLTTLNISIHGHVASLHERITRRAGSFSEALAGIEAARSAQKQNALGLKLLSTVNGLNVSHLPEMADFAFGFEPDSYGLNAVFLTGAALANADVVAVSYDAIIESFERCIRPEPRDISLSEVPHCRIHGRLPVRYLGMREDFHFVQLDDQGRIQGSQVARAPAGRGFAFRAACGCCAYRPVCDGVAEAYLERFGWDGFDPVGPESIAQLAADAQQTDRPPFERSDILLELLTPPAEEWEVLSLTAGPTDALAELKAGSPNEVSVTLVITPRDEAAEAFRRTRFYNVAIRGKSATQMQCDLAEMATRWMGWRELRIKC